MDDLDFMREALSLARKAAEMGEVPVGCVIVRGQEIVRRGHSERPDSQGGLRSQ